MNKILRTAFSCLGAVLGVLLVYLLFHMGVIPSAGTLTSVAIYLFGAGIAFFLFRAIAPPVFSGVRRLVESLSEQLRKVPLNEIITRTAGLLLGLLIASFVSTPLLQLRLADLGNTIGVLLAVLIYLILGLLGMRLAVLYHEDIVIALQQIYDSFRLSDEERMKRALEKEKRKQQGKHPEEALEGVTKPKILDTSVIIDARIFEVLRTGFLEGPIVISHYVLEELQHMSDSSDSLRRERGRRGLDAIHELQKQGTVEIVINHLNINPVKEVDSKLLLLTQRLGGQLVTTDFNLNKVATVQSIPVLNVNELVNALKPVVIPGDPLRVSIIKPGKESGQGLGYLDDGTMIVVENGYSNIGSTVDTVVTSVLQTAAGKMIFSRIPELP